MNIPAVEYLRVGRQNAMTAAEVAAASGMTFHGARRGLNIAARQGRCRVAARIGGAVYWMHPPTGRRLVNVEDAAGI